MGIDGAGRTLFERLLAPLTTEADRGLQMLELEIDTAPDAELLFEVTAVPAGNWPYDWAAVGPFTIRPAK